MSHPIPGDNPHMGGVQDSADFCDTRRATIGSFRLRLLHELTELDRRESAGEVKRRYPVNIYRLSLYLGAANDVLASIEDGSTPEDAFTSAFTPSRGMHTVARRLRLRLDVERGRWIPLATSPAQN